MEVKSGDESGDRVAQTSISVLCTLSFPKLHRLKSVPLIPSLVRQNSHASADVSNPDTCQDLSLRDMRHARR